MKAQLQKRLFKGMPYLSSGPPAGDHFVSDPLALRSPGGGTCHFAFRVRCGRDPPDKKTTGQPLEGALEVCLQSPWAKKAKNKKREN